MPVVVAVFLPLCVIASFSFSCLFCLSPCTGEVATVIVVIRNEYILIGELSGISTGPSR